MWLGNAGGEKLRIGSVSFEPLANGRSKFALRIDESRFGEYFLAMRPFRCLAGSSQHLCHFPYGGEREVALDDLAALEYQLLFMHKKPASVNLDPRNGLYWKLAADGERREWNGTLWVHEFHVRPEVQRRGIGRQLMDELARRAAAAGLRALTLETQNTNVAAIRFYRALGLSIEGIDVGYYSNDDLGPQGTVAVFMRRRLR